MFGCRSFFFSKIKLKIKGSLETRWTSSLVPLIQLRLARRSMGSTGLDGLHVHPGKPIDSSRSPVLLGPQAGLVFFSEIAPPFGAAHLFQRSRATEQTIGG